MTAPLLNRLLVMHPKVMFFNKPVSKYTNPPVFAGNPRSRLPATAAIYADVRTVLRHVCALYFRLEKERTFHGTKTGGSTSAGSLSSQCTLRSTLRAPRMAAFNSFQSHTRMVSSIVHTTLHSSLRYLNSRVCLFIIIIIIICFVVDT